mmetsp:Transcript_27249/g.78987  ORF Transcript_27249/g.78987 Transcript_27249/m.78987 type:complete len:306 (-) Transcript_27249:2391-3308(-)
MPRVGDKLPPWNRSRSDVPRTPPIQTPLGGGSRRPSGSRHAEFGTTESLEPTRWTSAQSVRIRLVAADEKYPARTAAVSFVLDAPVATKTGIVAKTRRALIDDIGASVRQRVVDLLSAVDRGQDHLCIEIPAVDAVQTCRIAIDRPSGKRQLLFGRTRGAAGEATGARRDRLTYCDVYGILVGQDAADPCEARGHQGRIIVRIEKVILRRLDHQVLERIHRQLVLESSNDHGRYQGRLRLRRGLSDRCGIRVVDVVQRPHHFLKYRQVLWIGGFSSSDLWGVHNAHSGLQVAQCRHGIRIVPRHV